MQVLCPHPAAMSYVNVLLIILWPPCEKEDVCPKTNSFQLCLFLNKWTQTQL